MTPAEAYSKTPGARYLHLTHALVLLREPPFGTGRHTDIGLGHIGPTLCGGRIGSQDLPPDLQDLLLAAASAVLAKSDLLRARLAGALAADTAAPSQKARAMAVARDALAKVDLDEDSTVWVCHPLKFIDRASNPDLRRQVLNCAGHVALRSRDSGLLLLAAAMWFDSENATP